MPLPWLSPHRIGLPVLLAVLLAACAQPAGSPARPGGAPQPAAGASVQPTVRKQITIGVFREYNFLPNDPSPGAPDVRHLANPGITVLDDRGNRQPLLAEAVPTIENGLWKLLPDGSMETTWTIRQGATWHDGAPLTADDLLFTAQVDQDPDVGAFGSTAFQSVDGAVAVDARTVTVHWKQPYIDADQMFTQAYAYLLPRHILDATYQQDKASLTEIPYWTQEYVGSGPYKLRTYDPGSRIVLDAFDQYLPGRPKIDEIDLAYQPDPNTVLAGLQSGTIDLTIGSALPIDATLAMRDSWAGGHFAYEFSDHRWFNIDPQFLNPTPAIIGDLRFRQALLTAINRQEMADTLEGGLSPVANSFMSPDQPQYQSIEQAVPKYPYDPRKAAQTIEDLGYHKGPDGIYLGADNQKLEVEIWGSSASVSKPMLSVAGYWQTLGVSTVTSDVPAQRSSDWPWRATFPGFQMFTGTNDLDGLPALYSSRTMLPENNFTFSGIPNWPRYQSPVLDGLLDRYYTTIPLDQRLLALTDINVLIATNLNLMGLYYFPTPYGIASRMVNIPENRAAKASIAWNAQLWDLKS